MKFTMPLSRAILHDHSPKPQRPNRCRAQAAAVESRTVRTTTDRSCSRLAAMPAIACLTSAARSSTEAASRLTLPILAETSFAAEADSEIDREISRVAASCSSIAAATEVATPSISTM